MARSTELNRSLSTLRRLSDVKALVQRRAFLQGSMATALVGSTGYFTSIAKGLADTNTGIVRRRAAHLLRTDDAEIQALRDAVAALKNNNGVGGWRFLATYHRDFCGVMQSKEIHWSWYFLPWHRVYLAVFERHLQAAISEPTLAIPYWDWYSSRAIPTIYSESDNPLLDATRSPSSPEMNDGDLGILSEAELVAPDNFERFAGGTFGNVGQLEGGPHGGGHMYAGGNMTAFPTAALDPLFLAHHGNIDRAWEVWRGAGTAAPRREPSDDAWNERPFVFFGPDGNEVRRLSRETNSTRDLGYEYDNTTVAGVIVAANTDGLALPLGAGEELALPLTSSDGRADSFQLTSDGSTFRPTLPDQKDIATALSTATTSSVAEGFKVSLKLSGIKLSGRAFQLQVFLNPAAAPEVLDPTQPSFAGSLNIIATQDAQTSINAYVSLNRTAKLIDKPLADVPIVIKIRKALNGQDTETVSIEKAELVIE